jgi:hypothetical protein
VDDELEKDSKSGLDDGPKCLVAYLASATGEANRPWPLWKHV